MKTIKVLVCAVLLGIITVNAQENQPDNIEFGVKGGVHLSKFKSGSNKNKTGLMAGFFLQKEWSEKFAFRAELLYAALGAKSKVNKNKVKLNYINVPLLLKFYPVDKLSIEGGGQLGYLLGGKGQGFQKSNYKKFDYGISAGIGYLISENLELGIRYYRGLANISKVNNASLKNTAFQLSLALTL
ncbi:MAG TPA: PorT family protein [Flavobacteriia bacterium]|nr:PorT family protein [Flavobacteriia bacterium]